MVVYEKVATGHHGGADVRTHRIVGERHAETVLAPGPAGGRYGGAIATAALISFRLGGSDGVAIEAAKWRWALEELGFATMTVAGEGPVDVTVPGLEIDAADGPNPEALTDALAPADLVVVENLCSLPLNPKAWETTATVLAGRPAVLHHHDLPWQRSRFAAYGSPPDDPAWRHVTINERSRRELAARGIPATTIYNSFSVPEADPDWTWPGRSHRGWKVRSALGVDDSHRLMLQPTRALERKNVAGGLAMAARLGATFWLLGPAEDGYGPELERLLSAATVPVLRGMPSTAGSIDDPITVDDAYAACDVVALPSLWEGFGNPSIESAIHRRPLVIGPYPVADELRSFGFDWFGLDDDLRLDAWLDAPDANLIEHNRAVAAAHFSIDRLPERIRAALPPW